MGIAGGCERTCKTEIDGCTAPIGAIADPGPAVIINVREQSAARQVCRADIDFRIAPDCPSPGSHVIAVGNGEKRCARRADVLRSKKINNGTTADSAAAVWINRRFKRHSIDSRSPRSGRRSRYVLRSECDRRVPANVTTRNEVNRINLIEACVLNGSEDRALNDQVPGNVEIVKRISGDAAPSIGAEKTS